MTIEQLLSPELRAALPRLYATGENSTVQAKFFYPDFDWTWYAIEFDGEDIFYGLVDGFELEYGSFSLRELRENRGKLGCEIERDLYFKPVPARELYRTLEARRKSAGLV